MQGLSLGPADLAANRRMKTTRVGGGHPGYLVRADPDPDAPRRAPPDLPAGPVALHARPHGRRLRHLRRAARTTGRSATSPTRSACEDQFRNAYLLGCVGAWSLHPSQIDIARRVFSPDPADVAHALRVIEAMGDGTGAIMLDGKMEDDASVKQCRVIVELARQLAATRSRARRALLACPDAIDDAAALGPLHAGGQRAGPGEGQDDPVRRRSSSTSRTPSPPTPRPLARDQAVAAVTSGDYGNRQLTIRCNGLATEWGADDLAAAAAARPPAVVIPKVDSLDHARRHRRAPRRRRRRRRPPIWAMVETPTAIFDVRALAAHPRVSVLVIGTNDLARELHAPLSSPGGRT